MRNEFADSLLSSLRTKLRHRIGVLVPANGSRYARLARVWDWLDELEVDCIAVEDHLLSPSADPSADQLECWSLLAAMAERTSVPLVTALVSPVSFRNPAVVAKAAITIDHISSGRFVLGIGAGWFVDEYRFAGLSYQPMGRRLADVENLVQRCREIWLDDQYQPKSVSGKIPILIGGSGSKIISLAAQIADAWNGGGPLSAWVERNSVLNAACHSIGRAPSSVVRTAVVELDEVDKVAAYREAGADLIIVSIPDTVSRPDLERYLRQAASL